MDKCNHWTCEGCDKCGGWKNNPDVEKACIDGSCECHSKCNCEIKCDGDCRFEQPYGFVPHAECPLHHNMTEDERKSYNNIGMDERETKIKNLFDMVYDWGRVGVVANFESNAFRKALKEIIKIK